MRKLFGVLLVVLTVAFVFGCSGGGDLVDTTPPNAGALIFPFTNNVGGVPVNFVNANNNVITWNGTDNVKVWKVVFTVDNAVVSEDDTAPFTFDASALPEGNHTIAWVVYDRAGNSTMGGPADFVVDRTAPVADVDTPGTLVMQGATNLGGDLVATDATSGLWKAELYYNGNLVASDDNWPPALVFDPDIIGYQNGTYTFTFRVYDNAGNYTEVNNDYEVIVDVPANLEFLGIFKPNGEPFKPNESIYGTVIFKFVGYTHENATLYLYCGNMELGELQQEGNLWTITVDTTTLPEGGNNFKVYEHRVNEAGLVDITNTIPGLNAANPVTVDNTHEADLAPVYVPGDPAADVPVIGGVYGRNVTQLQWTDTTTNTVVTKVDFYVDGELVGTDPEPAAGGVFALDYPMTTIGSGTHTFHIVAYNVYGDSVESNTITFYVDVTSPELTMNTPADRYTTDPGASYEGNAYIVNKDKANATDGSEKITYTLTDTPTAPAAKYGIRDMAAYWIGVDNTGVDVINGTIQEMLDSDVWVNFIQGVYTNPFGNPGAGLPDLPSGYTWGVDAGKVVLPTTGTLEKKWDAMGLTDGWYYTFTFVAMDNAGNVSNVYYLKNVAFDIHAPTVAISDNGSADGADGAWNNGGDKLSATATITENGFGIDLANTTVTFMCDNENKSIVLTHQSDGDGAGCDSYLDATHMGWCYDTDDGKIYIYYEIQNGDACDGQSTNGNDVKVATQDRITANTVTQNGDVI